MNDEVDYSSNEDFAELKAIEFANPYEMMLVIDPDIASDRITPYDWQINFHREVGEAKASDKNPWHYAVVAGNGAGKDSFIISWLTMWFVVSKVRSKVILTSGSVNQVNTQTEPYIRDIAKKVNVFLSRKTGTSGPFIKVQKHYIRSLFSGSEIRMFATDEPLKAEGHHPSVPGAEMLILVNEAKAVKEEIFEALHRCTGYSHWLEISSPGRPTGHFYKSVQRNKHIVVDYTMCPHISEEQRLRDAEEKGVGSSFYRSCYLGLFTTHSEESVVDVAAIEHCRGNPPAHRLKGKFYIGGDIAGGKDKNTLVIFEGNKYLTCYSWREKNMALTPGQFVSRLIKYPGAEAAFDYNAIGQPIVDMIRADPRIADLGITIIGERNQAKPRDGRLFGNRGAEIWVKGSRMISKAEIICDFKHTDLVNQLITREFSRIDDAKMYLKKKTHHNGTSPDEADSFMLALSRIPADLVEDKPEVEESFDFRRHRLFNFAESAKSCDTRDLIKYGDLY